MKVEVFARNALDAIARCVRERGMSQPKWARVAAQVPRRSATRVGRAGSSTESSAYSCARAASTSSTSPPAPECPA
jgi:hypothetical protein